MYKKNNLEKPWKSISKDAKMLIMALLDKNIDRRPTASEALNFSWFKLANKSDLVVHFEDLHSLDRYQVDIL
jgi:serine/threonine protein kinase